MSLPKELLDDVEALAERFGFSNLQEAVHAVSFSPAGIKGNADGGYIWNSELIESNLQLHCDHRSAMKGTLSILNAGYITNYSEVVLTIDESISDRDTKKIIQAMNSHNERRLEWGEYYDTSLDPYVGRWCKLVILSYSDNVKSILEHPSMVIFPCVKISFSDNTIIPDELMLLLQRLVCRHGSLVALFVENATLSNYDCCLLQRMLDQKSFHELSFDAVAFSDNSICFEHLLEGLGALLPRDNKGEEDAHAGLKLLAFHNLEIMLNPRFHRAQCCRLLHSLAGLPGLRFLAMSLPCEATVEIQGCLGDLLVHPDCNLKSLQLDWVHEENDASGATFAVFFNAFRLNETVSSLKFAIGEYTEPIIKQLFQTALLPRKHVWRIEVDEGFPPIRDLSKYICPTEEFDASKTFECKINAFLFCWIGLFDNDTSEEQRDTNIQCLLYLLKDRLPYLADIGLVYNEWQTTKAQIADTAGPDSQSAKDWDQVWTCLERNQVGMALLQPSVVLSVPLGLWPLIVARTTMKMSSPVEGEEWDRDENPVDGLFEVVRRLCMGGYYNKPLLVETLTTNGENKRARLD
jgi:hypothetical protein